MLRPNRILISETENFVWRSDWSTSDGPWVKCYTALNKETGAPATVKMAEGVKKDIEFQKGVEFQRGHKNIIKMIGSETLLSKGFPVLILENLDGPSLNEIMTHPKNKFGLLEDEILKLLHDLVAVKVYLKRCGIVHGNLQGSNIYRLKTKDGKTIFKVTGFDMAVRIAGRFLPLLLIKTLRQDTFNVLGHLFGLSNGEEKYDLWHIGRVLYMAIVGDEPFRFEFFNDPTLLQEILGGKPSGAISGVLMPDGHVAYDDKLPEKCLINKNLRELIEPILSGILDKDFDQIWSCEQFFEQARDLLSRKPFHVYVFSEAQNVTLYMKAEETWRDVTEAVSKSTNVPVDMQIYLFQDREDLLYPEETLTAYETSPENPVILLDLRETVSEELLQFGFPSSLRDRFRAMPANKNTFVPPDSSLSDTISVCFEYFGSQSDVKPDDIQKVRNFSAVAHAVAHSLAFLSQQLLLNLFTIKYLTKYFKELSVTLGKKKDLLTEKFQTQQNEIKWCKNSFSIMSNLSALMVEPDSLIEVDSYFQYSSFQNKHYCLEEKLIAQFELDLMSFESEIKKLGPADFDLSRVKNVWNNEASIIIDTLEKMRKEFELEITAFANDRMPNDKTTDMHFLVERKEFDSLMKDLLRIVKDAEGDCLALYQNKIDCIRSLYKTLRFYRECHKSLKEIEVTFEVYDAQISEMKDAAMRQLSDVDLSLVRVNHGNNQNDGNNQNQGNTNDISSVFQKLNLLQETIPKIKCSFGKQNDYIKRLNEELKKTEEMIAKTESV